MCHVTMLTHVENDNMNWKCCKKRILAHRSIEYDKKITFADFLFLFLCIRK